MSTENATETQNGDASAAEKNVVALAVKGDEGQSVTVYQSKLPNNRPVATGTLEVKEGAILNRPVSISKLDVKEVLPGGRPIVASGLEVSSSITVAGNRPIMASTLQVSELGFLPGGRPIASNQIDDPKTLMGYLD